MLKLVESYQRNPRLRVRFLRGVNEATVSSSGSAIYGHRLQFVWLMWWIESMILV
jgi:hypothetical protein